MSFNYAKKSSITVSTLIFIGYGRTEQKILSTPKPVACAKVQRVAAAPMEKLPQICS